MTRNEVIGYIGTLEGYEGYVQLSHRPIDVEKDVFIGRRPHVSQAERGFVLEAHFYHREHGKSVSIRQVGDVWVADETHDVPLDDVSTYLSELVGVPGVRMARIWQAEPDALCEGMKVETLKKVVFAGFDEGAEI